MFQSTRPHGARPGSARLQNTWTLCFNPRARTGRDDAMPPAARMCCCFNPRARTGRDLRRAHTRRGRLSFNPRARTGRDVRTIGFAIGPPMFQSTRPHGARPARHVGSRGLCLCFNPRARTGRDSRDTLSGRVYRSVSIHAPARGATTDIPSECCTNAFQSTRPHGARPMHEAGKPAFVRVSIHAPARGATSASDVRQAAATGFNPRARTGRDWSRAALISSIDLFQSTRPHGARPSASMALACFSSFQSTRPHGARRPPTLPQFVALCVSIHAPARGATGIFRMLPSCAGCFNPRARTGRDEISAILLQLVLMFQSTRPHGARLESRSRT